jgi:inner membrane protein
MPSVFSHAIAAFAAGKVLSSVKVSPGAISRKLLITGMICAAIPDLDAIGFWNGVSYESLWGHRGITHSFFFAFILASVVMQVMFSSEKCGSKPYFFKWFYLFIATTSHPLLDAMTNGGLGVALFAPFDNRRYFFPFRPIHVSPISITRFFSGRGLAVFKSEFLWIWVPSLLAVVVMKLIKGNKSMV